MAKKTNNCPQNTTQNTKYGETQIMFNAKTGSARSMPKLEAYVK